MNLIKNIDFLSFKVSFTFNDKGEIRLKTIMGGILSIFLLLLSSIFTFYFLIRLFNRQDANVIYSTTFNRFYFSIHLSRNAICSTVWNQCSPPSITVKGAPIFWANSRIVSSEVKLSFEPYRILVGTCHSIGFSRT